MSLRRILNYFQGLLVSYLSYLVHRGRMTEEMDRHNRLSSVGNLAPKVVGIQGESIWINIAKNGPYTQMYKRGRRCHERERGDNHFISFP